MIAHAFATRNDEERGRTGYDSAESTRLPFLSKRSAMRSRSPDMQGEAGGEEEIQVYGVLFGVEFG